jgi:hypothetical protein
MSRLVIFIILITLVNSIKSQDSLRINKKKLRGISISYFAEYFTHYGVKIGTEYPLWTKEKVKVKNNSKEVPKQKLLFVAGNIGCYIHRRNHVGLFINSELGYRKNRNRGLKYEVLLGVGYLHTFLQGDTYIDHVPLAGQSNLMASLAFGMGYDFHYHYQKSFSIFIKPGFFVQYPFGTAVAMRPTVDFGIYYYFNK